jgi:DNA-binding MarR family transcriptional regulator
MYRELRAVGVEVTPEQWLVLTQLWQADGLSQAALSERTGRDTSTMSRIVTSMERSRLVERFIDYDRDARRCEVRLAAKGRVIQPRLVSAAHQVAALVGRDIPSRELTHTYETLTRVLRRLR